MRLKTEAILALKIVSCILKSEMQHHAPCQYPQQPYTRSYEFHADPATCQHNLDSWGLVSMSQLLFELKLDAQIIMAAPLQKHDMRYVHACIFICCPCLYLYPVCKQQYHRLYLNRLL
jgi:hypothetical protein